MTLWCIWMSASRISPVRGSWMFGPDAFSVVEGNHRMTEYRASSGLHFGSSSVVGACFAMIAFLKPASSNAGCHDSMPFLMYGRHFNGVAESIQYTIGLTGSDTAA